MPRPQGGRPGFGPGFAPSMPGASAPWRSSAFRGRFKEVPALLTRVLGPSLVPRHSNLPMYQASETVFVAVLGLLCIYLALGLAAALAEARAGAGLRKEVLGFVCAVILLLLLGLLAYSTRFAPLVSG